MSKVNVALDQAVAQGMADALAIAGVAAGGQQAPVDPYHPPHVTIIEMDFANPKRMNLPMTPEKEGAIHFRTGPTPTPGANPLVTLVAAEITGTTPPYPRQAALSMLPGFYDDSLDKTLIGSTSTTVTAHFSIDPTDPGYVSYPALLPNTDYYLSIRVQPNSAPAGSDCSMVCDLNKPGGM